jgi:hypothetical protein
MNSQLHKFPHTPHLLWLGSGVPRDDKVMPPTAAGEFLSETVTVEEKVDGANLGLSLGADGRIRPQSRANYLAPGRSHAQWDPLWPWLANHREALEDGLRGELILYGEWCYARHTVPYNALPDWFLAFDIFEIASGGFWSSDRRNNWLAVRGLVPVPQVTRGRFALGQVPHLIATSAVGHVPMEGVYLRREKDGWLEARAKVVGTAFKQQIEPQWTRRAVVPNQLATVAQATRAQSRVGEQGQ